jgi:hypothetical protein
MSPITPLFARRARLAVLVMTCAAPLAFVQAQTVPPPPDVSQATPDGRQNQKIEHITVEDSGARVDEVRYGGQTQSITVQPKANVPSYSVLPNDGGRDRQGQSETSNGGNGARVWNLFKF